MKLSNQCCTLEQGRKLKELGIAENSVFAWVSVCYGPLGEKDPALEVVYRDDYSSIPAKYGEYQAPAFTVSEIIQMLPEQINDGTLTIEKGAVFIREDMDPEMAYTVGCKKESVWQIVHGRYSLADSSADCLIFLLETGLLTAEEANNRLINS